MIARPKISRNEWKSAEKGAFEIENFAPFSCPGDEGAYASKTQTFLKYPSPETNWNTLDQVISGFLSPAATLSSVKFRRVLFALVPPRAGQG